MTRPVALVTGGGQGIGAATCKRLSEDGYDILLTYNNSSKPAEMLVADIRESGGDALAVKVDCSDDGEVGLLGIHPWMAKSIDVLVLNHGAYNRISAKEMTLEDLRKTMAINFEGAVSVWKAVQQHLTAEARIVVVGSQLGTRGSPHGADYSASKAALAIWARSLAQEVGPEGKRVNVLAPGYVDTAILAGDSKEKRMTRENEVPLKRVGSPEDMASTISFLTGQDSSYITGAIIHVNGGLYLP
ncbi:MAG: SDR family oxidoreductase [Euryarchaeota archaeon]|jgi:3-oxoacyl-[acyl-carrier protein] reductase|nr:SDR family oxidoreductase [Euryarchaeota archaeon]MBT4924375.1 SDR family oxidoreductase [Euryarchaeota archaeon]MBT5736354.1 SDR family oxidoreductase [Euryarchaeota archaeon]MBT7460666.1 SDR family oxidoreductase [Euryarchaeota archaeon]